MPSSTTLSTGQIWCLDPGPLRPLVDQFTCHLASLGHTALTVRGYSDAARHLLVWLQRSGVAIADVNATTCTGFVSHHCQCPGIRRGDRVSAKYARRAGRFVRFLSERGLIERMTPSEPPSKDARVTQFQQWLRQHRGIAECTISKHASMVTRLLAALGPDPTHYTAATIRQAPGSILHRLIYHPQTWIGTRGWGRHRRSRLIHTHSHGGGAGRSMERVLPETYSFT